MKCQVGWLAHFATHVLTSTLIRNVRIFVVHEYCTPRTDTNTNRCSCLLASCSVCEASIRPLDEHPLQNKGQVFVPMDEYPPQHMGQIFVPWTNTFSSTWGKYSSTDEYPLPNTGQVLVHGYPCRNMGQVFVHRRITSQQRGGNTCW